MVTRKCGTCRFFRDAEIACSGWCTHPERGDLHDLVLVRRAELACRNTWDKDLWEQSERPLERVPSAGVKSRVPSPAFLPEDPTDRVTAIDIARPPLAEAAQSRHPAVAGGQGSQVAAKQTSVSNRENKSASDQSRAGVSSLEPSFSRALHGPTEKRSFRTAVDSAVSSTLVASSWPKREQQPPVPQLITTKVRESSAVELIDDTAPLPIREVNLALQREVGTHAKTLTVSEPEFSNDGALPPDPIIHVDGLNREVGRERDEFHSDNHSSNVATHARSPLDESPWVAGIPRCCDTCREFHRDRSGKTGYCRSPYAFGSRTMVQSDQLACRSGIGVWWLPSDDTWLEKADISHHTRPTPYLDAILANLRPES